MEDKAVIAKHKSYIVGSYEGEDPSVIEQLISLYKATYGFHDRGLLGVLDRGAWTCQTPKMLSETISPSMLRSYRSSTPMDLMFMNMLII